MLWTVWMFHCKWWKDVWKNMDIKETVAKQNTHKKPVISKANIEPDVHSEHTYWRRVIFFRRDSGCVGKGQESVWRKDDDEQHVYFVSSITVFAALVFRLSHGLSVHFLHWYRDIRTKQHTLGKVCGDSTTKLVASRLHRICFLRGPRSSKKTTAQCKILASQCRGKDRMVIIPCMVWPSQNHDINIIENIWPMLKVNLHRRVQDVHSQTNLISAVKEI